jgi:hypothetical protein
MSGSTEYWLQFRKAILVEPELPEMRHHDYQGVARLPVIMQHPEHKCSRSGYSRLKTTNAGISPAHETKGEG